jgi:hypothetical protein
MYWTGPTTPGPALKGSRVRWEVTRCPCVTSQLRWEATNLFKPNLCLLHHATMSFIARDATTKIWLSKFED